VRRKSKDFAERKDVLKEKNQPAILEARKLAYILTIIE
tara:strand:+ start:326 stop:439 length:114 start_codon:yes stop_codon:yes gene_type:complete